MQQYALNLRYILGSASTPQCRPNLFLPISASAAAQCNRVLRTAELASKQFLVLLGALLQGNSAFLPRTCTRVEVTS